MIIQIIDTAEAILCVVHWLSTLQNATGHWIITYISTPGRGTVCEHMHRYITGVGVFHGKYFLQCVLSGWSLCISFHKSSSFLCWQYSFNHPVASLLRLGIEWFLETLTIQARTLIDVGQTFTNKTQYESIWKKREYIIQNITYEFRITKNLNLYWLNYVNCTSSSGLGENIRYRGKNPYCGRPLARSTYSI